MIFNVSDKIGHVDRENLMGMTETCSQSEMGTGCNAHTHTKNNCSYTGIKILVEMIRKKKGGPRWPHL